MAYCSNCGAYIPDGQTKCLACGYDSASRSSGNYAYSYDAAQAAKEEKQRREQERKERQEEYRRRAEEEAARRQARQRAYQAESNAHRAHPYSSAGDVRGSHPYSRSGNMRGEKSNRLLAALSYLSILFLVPFAVCPEDEFARYHARQGVLLFFFGLVADVVGSIFSIGWVITLFRLYCIYKGMTNASAGRMEPLPLIGKYAEK